MKQRGDTIIEVLLAVTVFSLVAVGGMAIMNQGAAMAQRSLEIGLVRQQIDAQADALRYIHNAYVTSSGSSTADAAKEVWDSVATKHAVTQSQPFNNVADGQRCYLPSAAPRANSDPANTGEPFAIDIRKLDGKNTPGIAPANADPVIAYEHAALSETIPINAMSVSASAGFPVTFAQVRYKSMTDLTTPAVAHGVWIQAVHSDGVNGSLPYYDFNIRACWLTPGQSAPVKLATVVRLYDPRP